MTSATAQARPEPVSGFSRARRAFRNWRRTRPFWGGLLVLIAGFPILYFPYATLSLGGLSLHLSTSAGASSLVIGLLLFSIGISVWFQPLIRIFAGIAALVLTLVSIPQSNLAGFGLGLIPGLIGGALILAWAPLKEQPVEELPEPDGQEHSEPAVPLSDLMGAQPQAALEPLPAEAQQQGPAPQPEPEPQHEEGTKGSE